MSLEKYFKKPSNEYQLLLQIAHEIQLDFKRYHGPHYYLHLNDCGHNQSQLDEFISFIDPYELGHYLYIERDKEACIVMRSDESAMTMLLNGEYVFVEIQVTESEIITTYGPKESHLKFSKTSKMTGLQIMQAFGLIKESLQESKRNKVS